MSTLIQTDGEQTIITPKHGDVFSLSELQEYVGGYIEFLSLPDGRAMVVNEEGMLKGLPRNDTATVLAYTTQTMGGIVGDVVVCEWEALK